MADQQELQVCKKDDLKTSLKAHGLKVSGRKQELIVRVRKAKQDGTELIVNKRKEWSKSLKLLLRIFQILKH